MKNLITSFFLFLCATAFSQVVPPPASQAEVNTGTDTYKYVTPATLAGHAGGSATNAQPPSGVLTNLSNGTGGFTNSGAVSFTNAANSFAGTGNFGTLTSATMQVTGSMTASNVTGNGFGLTNIQTGNISNFLGAVTNVATGQSYVTASVTNGLAFTNATFSSLNFAGYTAGSVTGNYTGYLKFTNSSVTYSIAVSTNLP